MTLTQIKPAGLSKPVDLADNEQIRLGTGNDLLIYHNGSNSFIKDNATAGQFIIDGYNGIDLRQGSTGELMTRMLGGGAVELYHNNSKKFQTTSTGVDILGSDTTGSNLNGDLVINNAAGTRYAVFDASHTKLNFSDNASITLGDSNDLQIFHDGSHSFIRDTGTGALQLSGNRITMRNGDAASEYMFAADENGAVELYYDNVKKFETTSVGIRASGNYQANDGYHIYLGTGNDLDIYHDGSSSYVSDVGTGSLKITTNGTGVDIQKGSSETIARFIADGAVELYYDNVKTFHTKQNGVVVEGTEGSGAVLEMRADQGDDNADYFRFYADPSVSNLYFQNYASGGWETNLRTIGNGGVELWHDNSLKVATRQAGLVLHNLPDNAFLLLDQNGRQSSFNNYFSSSSTGSKISVDVSTGATDGTKTRSVDFWPNGMSFNGDTADANKLNDYEEGTWTPASNGGYTTQSTGSYTKIGKMVYAAFNIDISSNSDAGHATIQGLPFAVENSNPNANGVAKDYQTYDIENGPIYHLGKGQTQIVLYKNNGAALQHQNISGKNLRGTAIYRA